MALPHPRLRPPGYLQVEPGGHTAVEHLHGEAPDTRTSSLVDLWGPIAQPQSPCDPCR